MSDAVDTLSSSYRHEEEKLALEIFNRVALANMSDHINGA